MGEEIIKHEQLINALEDYTDFLTPDQLKVLPYLAHGVSIGKTASTTKTSPATIRKWIDEDVKFYTALTIATRTISEWQMKRLNEVSVKAWDVVDSILSQNYNEVDDAEKREIARTARHVIDKLGLNKDSDLHVTHEVVAPELNVSEQSADAIAKRIMELEKYGNQPAAVDGEYRIKETDTRFQLHPETDYGKINVDRDKKRIQCHVCGEWTSSFIDHIDLMHGLTFEEYKVMYRLGEDVTERWLNEL